MSIYTSTLNFNNASIEQSILPSGLHLQTGSPQLLPITASIAYNLDDQRPYYANGSVWNSLSFGTTGSSGLQGNTGPTGQAGHAEGTGSTGPVAMGLTGSTGQMGNSGQTGQPGLDGNMTGNTGQQGTQGIQGNTGLQGVTGNTGQQGSTGIGGPQGLTGSTGIIGLSLTGSTGQVGFTGQAGNTGQQGPTGLEGFTGVTGNTGQTGPTGLGTTGNTGIQGNTGLGGPFGPTGSSGQQGNTGPGGSTGSASNAALTATQVGYGSASNLLTGTSDFTWTDSTTTLSLNGGQIYLDAKVGTGQDSFIAIGNVSPQFDGPSFAYVTTVNFWFTGTAIGDCAIRAFNGSAVHIGAGTAGVAPLVVSSTGIQFLTAGGTRSILGVYESAGQISATFSGPWTSNQTVTLSFTRIGNIISLFMPSIAVAATGTTVATSTISIPSRFVPTVQCVQSAVVINSSANAFGFFEISTSGILSFAPPSGAFTASGNAGIQSATFTYILS
jgi:hypothetical protein